MKTRHYKSYEAFLARKDKTLNGVLSGSPLPSTDTGNIGCWNCSNCRYCSDCSDCSGCSGCSGCRYCSDCRDCRDCRDCSRCSDCSDCSDCSRCRGIPQGAKYACFLGAYRYVCSPRIHSDGSQWVQMGCHLRTRTDWETDEWNNPDEFPNDDSQASKARHFALAMAYAWLDLNSSKQ